MAYTDIDKPSDYFETLLSTGDGGSQTFTGLDFQPDFVWSKRRQTHVHQLYDSVRTAGSGKALQSDGNAAEGGDGGTYGYLSSFTSNGFASTAGSSNNNYFNADGGTYVFWNWKESTTSGFDIISYTGTGSNIDLSHNLSAIPDFILIKASNGDDAWRVYSKSLGFDKRMVLSESGAFSTNALGLDSAPTASVINIGTDTACTNENNQTYICYAFKNVQGFSKFGSYTGNGNADGTFVYTGFKPAFVMVKNTVNNSRNWTIIDNKRNPFNPEDEWLYANANDSTYDASEFPTDFVSNGFKIRNIGSYFNTSGDNYIYMAFAENPFVTSTGVPATAR